MLCRKFSKLSERPTSQHKLAILFPDHDEQPRLIWIYCKRETDDGVPYESANARHLLGPDDPPSGVQFINHNVIRRRDLGHMLGVWHRDTFLFDGSRSNESIIASVGTSAPITHNWRGPCVALQCGRGTYGFNQDITLADFRHLIDYFVSYNYSRVRELDWPVNTQSFEREPDEILGVKVNSDTEMKTHESSDLCQSAFQKSIRSEMGHYTVYPQFLNYLACP